MFKDQQLLKILALPKIQRESKKSVSIFQSRQNIADLQSSFNDENDANTSLLLSTNRQINSGMILDMKQYEQSSKMKKHFIFKDGEKDEKIIFSYMILKQEKELPTEVIYRWIRKGNQMGKKDGNTFITEEEHIYSGGMEENRKHGDGQYIIIRKMSNAIQKRIRYKGIWKNDIFSKGVIEGEDGSIKTVESSPILSIKSKRGNFGKSQRNPTLKMIAEQMEKKKSIKQINIRTSNESHTSIIQKVNRQKSMKPALMTKNK